MADIRNVFATQVYQTSLALAPGFAAFKAELEAACRMLAQEDKAGRAWSRAHGYGGYTSYASLDDLPRRASVFADLERRVSRHVRAFADALAFDLGPRGRLALDALWVNVLRPGSGHSGHVHPLSVISGVFYVAVPPEAGSLRLEDPRLPLMMAAPTKRSDPPFVTLEPAAGALFLWESWLRHEVAPGRGRSARISISFNYAWR